MAGTRRIVSALLFLAASPRRLGRQEPRRFERLGSATMLLGLAWGLCLIALWDVIFPPAWRHSLNWVAPAVACAVAMVAGPHRRAALALVETAAGRRPWQRRIVGAAFTAGLSAIAELVRSLRRSASPEQAPAGRPAPERWEQWLWLATLGASVAAILNHAVRMDPDWPTRLPQSWAWLWPRALYRVLLLTPVWGAWSMLALGQFHRPSAGTDAAARHFALGVGPLTTAAWLAVPLAGSLIYLNFLFPWHFLPPVVALLAALGGGTLIVRLRGGLSRGALLATNFLTQVAFLVAYVTVK